jgi:DNA-binding transcriptional ArsR family regulator
MPGDVDLAAVGALLAEPARCRMLLALDDGRALPATRLADEAGVSAATASSHLRKLVDAGLLDVERHGRYRYYRLAGPAVGRLIETLGQLAPVAPVRSLRQHTRAHALREARTCYDHVAGRLGVALMSALLERGYLSGGDGTFDPDAATDDRLSAPGQDLDYALTAEGAHWADEFGVRIPPRRRAVGYCVDWTEQRHHVAGALGRGLRDRFLELDWVRRGEVNRALQITSRGRRGFAAEFAIELDGS